MKANLSLEDLLRYLIPLLCNVNALAYTHITYDTYPSLSFLFAYYFGCV